MTNSGYTILPPPREPRHEKALYWKLKYDEAEKNLTNGAPRLGWRPLRTAFRLARTLLAIRNVARNHNDYALADYICKALIYADVTVDEEPDNTAGANHG